MTEAELINFHVAKKTPLRRLGNGVRWLEEKKEKAKAKKLRRVISAIFVKRFAAGEYDEAA